MAIWQLTAYRTHNLSAIVAELRRWERLLGTLHAYTMSKGKDISFWLLNMRIDDQ